MIKAKSNSKATRTRASGAPAAAGVFEVLEDRRLFSVLTIDATAGNDVVNIVPSGTDLVVTRNGVATTYAAAPIDQIVVNCFAGDDRVNATNGLLKSLVVNAGSGNDLMFGGGGPDVFNGGDGNDLMDGRGGADEFNGGLGVDTADYSAWMTSISVSLDDLANDGKSGEADNVRSDVENVSGGAGADTLVGSSAANYLRGGGGLDTISGLDGNDVLDGGMGGALPVSKNTGNDVLYGGNGDDTLHASDYGNNKLYGEAGNDRLYGYNGNDTLSGGAGGDTVTGWTGNDVIYGGTGDDALFGEGGDDKIYGNDGPSARLVVFPTFPVVKLPLILTTDNDYLSGGDGNDLARGDGGDDTVSGFNGNDTLYGDTGNDNVVGGDGNDRLYAGAGDDVLGGGDGADVLVAVGGGQADQLDGDAGLDSFWMDAEPTETCDADFVEAILGNVHRVDAFQTLRTVDGSAVNTQAVNRELNGQDLLDPLGGGASTDFSDRPLFAAGGPGKNDVRQGGVGDCYFLAGLSAIAKTNANRIGQSVVDLGDGTYGVRFFQGGVQKFYRVDNDLPATGSTPSYAKLGSENSMWVAVMEKAFAFFRSNLGTYASINSGWMSEAFLGLGSSSYTETASGSNILGWLKGELDAGKAVTFATKDMAIPAGCPCIGSHAYSVERVNVQTISLPLIGNISITVSVTLRNPWGYDGAGSDADTADGYVTLTGDQAAAVLWKAQAAFV